MPAQVKCKLQLWRAIRASGLDLELATQRARAILEPARQTVPTDSGFYGQLIEVAGDDIHLITRILVSIRDQGAEYRKGSYWLEPVLRRLGLIPEPTPPPTVPAVRTPLQRFAHALGPGVSRVEGGRMPGLHGETVLWVTVTLTQEGDVAEPVVSSAVARLAAAQGLPASRVWVFWEREPA